MRSVLRVDQTWRRVSDDAILRVLHIHRGDRLVRGRLAVGTGEGMALTIVSIRFAELSNRWRLLG